MSPLDHIASSLRVGKPAILPTETVYGLAARADDPVAIDALYALKGREMDKPLALCVEGIDAAMNFVKLPQSMLPILEKLWPGPLTLVVSAKANTWLYRRMIASDGTLGLRCPDVFWRERLTEFPLALTSANRAGARDTTSAKAAYEAFLPEPPIVLDGGDSSAAKPSTVIRVEKTGLRLLRAGALPPEYFADFDIDWLV